MKYILLFLPILAFGLGSTTTKNIDQINNNTGTNIVLNPVSAVQINSLAGGFALQSNGLQELEESAVSTTELSFLIGVNSSIQSQIDSKTPTTRLLSTTAPLLIDGTASADLSVDRTLSMSQSGAASNGWLSSADWNTFNNKGNFSSPLTTNGDLLYYNTGDTRLGIGIDGQVLKVVSGLPSWENESSSSSPTTTQGDLITRGAIEDERLAIGSADQLLKVNSGATSIEYFDYASFFSLQSDTLSVAQNTVTKITWQVANTTVDEFTDFDYANNYFVVSQAGRYKIDCEMIFQYPGNNTFSTWQVRITKNGVTDLHSVQKNGDGSNATGMSTVSVPIGWKGDLIASDTIEIKVFHDFPANSNMTILNLDIQQVK